MTLLIEILTAVALTLVIIAVLQIIITTFMRGIEGKRAVRRFAESMNIVSKVNALAEIHGQATAELKAPKKGNWKR